MAKLSANGTELARLELHQLTLNNELTTESRMVISIRSNGRILSCRHVKFRPDWLHKDGYWHSYGWKRAARIRKGVALQRVIEYYEQRGYECQTQTARSEVMP